MLGLVNHTGQSSIALESEEFMYEGSGAARTWFMLFKFKVSIVYRTGVGDRVVISLLLCTWFYALLLAHDLPEASLTYFFSILECSRV